MYDSQPFRKYKKKFKKSDSQKFQNTLVVKYDNSAFLVNESTKEIIERRVLIRRVSHLINWLISMHTTIQISFYPNWTKEEAENWEIQLINWLISEIFTPDISIPVVGEIKRKNYPMDENAFHDVQIVLINYLTKTQSEELAISTSCSLLLKGYDHLKIQIPGLPKGSKEEKIIFLMEILTSNAQGFKINFEKKIESSVPKRYKDFQIPNEMEFPEVIIPSGHFNSIEGFGMIEKNYIIKKIEGFYTKKISVKKAHYFLDVPVYLVEDKITKLMLVKITAWKRQRTQSCIILKQANSILSYLMLSHLSLMEAIKKEYGNNMNIFLNNAWVDFIGWIKKELFEPEKSLPLFGTVSVEEVHKPLDASRFGDNQVAFLHCFQSSHVYKIFPIISIGFLGSWLKKYDQVLWNHHFHNDKTFVQFMIERLIADQDRFINFNGTPAHLERFYIPGSSSKTE
jgi:hypothetical protein